MTAQELLNLMYPPQRVSSHNINANNKLTSQEVNSLLQIVDDFELQGSNYNVDSALQTVSGVATKFITPVTKIGEKTVPITPKAMPLLIQQVLFYIAVRCKQYNLKNQSEIQNYLTDKCSLKIGRIYSKMPFEPSYYLSYRDYKVTYNSLPNKSFSQPKILFPYNGQKDKHLGVVIRNLVYQAGKFNRFIDVFGGTGSATLAFPHRGYTDYVYNELNDDLFNLMQVIKESTYKDLISELKDLKVALQDTSAYTSYEFRGSSIDFGVEMKIFYNRHDNLSKKMTSTEADIYNFSDADTYIFLTDDAANEVAAKTGKSYNRSKPSTPHKAISGVVDFMKLLEEEVFSRPDDFVFTFDNTAYTKHNLLDKFTSLETNYDIMMDYARNPAFYDKLADDLSIYRHLQVHRFNPDDEVENALDFGSDEDSRFIKPSQVGELAIQTRFYKWYCYFDNILNTGRVVEYTQSSGVVPSSLQDSKLPVRRALAYLFINSFITRNSVGISEILRIFVDEFKPKTKADIWKKFLNGKPDQSEIIITLHKHFKDVFLSNQDFRQVVPLQFNPNPSRKKPIKKSALYYVDSPYLGTTDYGSKAARVSSFGISDMYDLIDKLGVVAESGDKFIFSCRACISGKGTKSKKYKSSKVTRGSSLSNDILVENVFEKFKERFLDRGMPLWVVTICENSSKDFFKDIVANREVAEIMIYNYEVQPFEADIRFNNTKNAKYGFYTYEDFIIKLLPVLKTI